MKLKKDSLMNASKPARIVKQMDNVFKSKLNKTNVSKILVSNVLNIT